MKIGINTYFFKFPASGSGQYLFHLLQALAEMDQKNSYVLLDKEPFHEIVGTFPKFKHLITPVPRLARRNASIENLMWEQFTSPSAARKSGVDLLHVPYFAPPFFPRTPSVITIHDIIPLRMPQYRTDPKMKAYLQLITRAARKATMIITVSQHAKQDMLDALKLPAERIRVIYEAAGSEYHPITDSKVLSKVHARYGLHGRYILYLGGLDQRKNVPQLVRAFAQVYNQWGEPNLQLLIAGNPDKLKGSLFPDPRPVAADLGITDQIIYRFIEEEDKPAIYSGASVFVFPSLYEGFGLTPLEAMSCGTPVICSNRTSLPEVVGDAAINFDPDNVREMVQAMHSVLTNDELQADLRARSLRRASQFNWQKTAIETIDVYQEAFLRSKKR
ncbi:MAG: glycosyltransferase family 4 protein [Ktedonobacteraceae bacterium]